MGQRCSFRKSSNGEAEDKNVEETKTPLELDREKTLLEVGKRFHDLRCQLDKAENQVKRAVEQFYSQRAAKIAATTACDEKKAMNTFSEMNKAAKMNPKLPMIGRAQMIAGFMRQKLLGVPKKNEVQMILQMAQIPAAKIVTEKELQEFRKISSASAKLEKALQLEKKRLSSATTYRKRMEVFTVNIELFHATALLFSFTHTSYVRLLLPHCQFCTPTDLSEPKQTKICSFSDFAISVNMALVDQFIEQKGPACGAASVATAINVLLSRELLLQNKPRLGQEDLLEYYRKQRPKDSRFGGAKYPHVKSASTAGVGNALILKALKHFAKCTVNEEVKSGYWMGIGQKCRVRLTLSQSIEEQNTFRLRAWEQLKNNFPRSDSKAEGRSPSRVLIHHTKNHYSIIYGWREWKVQHGSKRGTTVRQCLTATFHQRPKSWMPWDNICDIVVKSKGFYCIMYVERQISMAAYFKAATMVDDLICAEGGEIKQDVGSCSSSDTKRSNIAPQNYFEAARIISSTMDGT
eukprot:jgi/Bigna1/72017/fgenesh1_pg.18_\